MEKNVYLVIPDMHLGNIFAANRKDYRAETVHWQRQLLQIAAKYKAAGCKITLLPLGDIYHNSYKNVTEALVDNEFIGVLKEKVGDIYTVMGNHELTYYKANPFYTAIRSVDSERVQGIVNKVWTPLGVRNIINVVDTLQDGEVTFYFNHYATGVQQPKSGEGVSIGLFHQDIIDPQIKAEVERSDTRLQFVNSTSMDDYLGDYDYCFFGHLHSVYGVWKSNKTFYVYLASLGRTNVTEVRDDFLERNVPAVIVEDGKFNKVEDNFIQLLPRAECVLEEAVTEMKSDYQLTKELQEVRNYIPLGDDPVQNLRMRFADNAGISVLLNELITRDIDSRQLELKRKMRELNIGNK